MVSKIFYILLAHLLFFVHKSYQIEGDYCFADDVDRYPFFSSLTPYSAVRSSTFKTPPSCTPIYVWGLIKHGIKFMSEKEYEIAEKQIGLKDQIERNRVDARDQLCEKDFQNIRTWQFSPLEKDQMDQITNQGIIEEGDLANSLQNSLRALLQPTNTKTSYEFYTSSSKLTQDSALAFTNKLLTTKFQDVKENGIMESDLLKNYDESTSVPEMDSFLLSETVQKVLREASKRVGFDTALSYDTILSWYQICAYQNAWRNENPALCAAFTQDHLKVFEYIHDLKHYYQFGYGNTKNERPRLLMMKDLLKKLKDAINEKSGVKKGSFYFSQTPQVSSTMVSLGLYRDDEALKQNNYEKMKDSRKWRSSRIDAFSANILAVVYNCAEINQAKKVGFYHNEELIKIPACQEDFCKLEELETAFKDVFNYDEKESKEPSKKPEDKKEDPSQKPEDKKEPPKKSEDKKEDPSQKPEDKKEPPKKPEEKKDGDEKSSANKIKPVLFNLAVFYLILFIHKL